MAVPTSINNPATLVKGQLGSAGGRLPIVRSLTMAGTASDTVEPGEAVEITGTDDCSKIDSGNALSDGNMIGIVVRDPSARSSSTATPFRFALGDEVPVLIQGRIALRANSSVGAGDRLSIDADNGTSFDDVYTAGNATVGASRWVNSVASGAVGWVDFDYGGGIVDVA